MPGLFSDMFADGGEQQQSTDIVADLDVAVSIDVETSYDATFSNGEGGTTTYSGGQNVAADVSVQSLLAAGNNSAASYVEDGA